METTLLFSGGTDSTLAAVLLLAQEADGDIERLHLVTYDHRWWTGHFRIGKAMRRGRELRDRFGADRVSHDLVRIGPLFHRFVTATLLDDYRRFHTNTCCVGCKLAMHTRTVLYNLERRIGRVADGSAADQDYHAEQLRGVLDVNRRLYARYGIAYSNPSFSLDTAARLERLRREGIRPKGLQPRCLFGAYDFFIYTPLHQIHREEEDVMVAYMEHKLPMAMRIIDEAMALKGLRPVNLEGGMDRA